MWLSPLIIARVSMTMIRLYTMTRSNLRRKGFISSLITLRSPTMTDKGQGMHPGTWGDWKAWKSVVNCLSLDRLFICSFLYPGSTCPGTAPLTMGLTLPHLSLTKKKHCRLAYRKIFYIFFFLYSYYLKQFLILNIFWSYSFAPQCPYKSSPALSSNS